MARTCPVCSATFDDASAFCPTDGATLVAAAGDGLVGAVIADRYRVVARLGEGGMGEVYRARHVRLPQDVAIKVLRPALARDPAMVARFVREAIASARIASPHVVRVLDAGDVAGGSAYIAMEFVDGRTLGDVLDDERVLAPARAARVIAQVAQALAAAHAIGIVHRDLKPDNVMLARDAAGAERALVLDFGIAKSMQGDGTDRLTRTGFVVGTPEYMSPEQIMAGDVGAPSDVFALALLACRCLAGALPWSTEGSDHGMLRRLTHPPATLAALRPDVAWPASLDAVLAGALERDPARRTPDVLAFADAFARAIDAWVAPSDGSAPVSSHAPAQMSSQASPQMSSQVSTQVSSPMSSQVSSQVSSNVRSSTSSDATPRAPAAATRRPGGDGRSRALALTAAVALLVAGGAAVAWRVRTPGGDTPSGTSPTSAAGAVVSPPDVAPPAPAVPPATPPARATRDGDASGATGPGAPVPAAGDAAASAARARAELARVTRLLDPRTSVAADHRRAVVLLQRLLPRLDASVDSTWALVRLVEAQLLLDAPAEACRALATARRVASTRNQREVVERYAREIPCGD
jgi:serine/threonine-protein kinase